MPKRPDTLPEQLELTHNWLINDARIFGKMMAEASILKYDVEIAELRRKQNEQ